MLKAAVAGLVLSISGFANATLITLDFDSLAGSGGGTVAPNSDFIPYIISFDQEISLYSGFNPSFGGSGVNVAANSENFASTVTGSFFQTVNSLSLRVGDTGGDLDTVRLEVYDVFNSLITSTSFTSESAFDLSVAGIGIKSFAIIDVNDSLIVFDTLVYNTEAPIVDDIPEPSTLAIFALGIMGLASRRFKKQ
jgi:hypothetical protein